MFFCYLGLSQPAISVPGLHRAPPAPPGPTGPHRASFSSSKPGARGDFGPLPGPGHSRFGAKQSMANVDEHVYCIIYIYIK